MANVLPNLKCNHCQGIIKPPIKICKNGHVLCLKCGNHCGQTHLTEPGRQLPQSGNCIETQIECSYLNILFEQMEDYCKYDCGIRAEAIALKEHEMSCPIGNGIRTTRCIVPECNSVVPMNDLINHVSSVHPELLIELPQQGECEFAISVNEPVKLVILFPKSYIFNELYWVRLFEEMDNRYVMLQHQGASGRITSHAHKIDTFTVTSTVNADTVVKGKCSTLENNYYDIIEDDYVEKCSANVTQLEGTNYFIKISNVIVGSLPESIISELECDICTNVMGPPIRICETGHSFCGDCAGKIQQCPHCRGLITNQRNFSLERITNIMNSPCKYSAAGCAEIVPSYMLDNHNRRCMFHPRRCIMGYCTWTGRQADLKDHIVDKHPYYIKSGEPWAGPVRDIVQEDYKNCIVAFDNFFIYQWNFKDGYSFTVDHITPNDTSEFWFDVKLTNPRTKHSAVFTSPCSTAYSAYKITDIVNSSHAYRSPKEVFNTTICDKNMYEFVIYIYKKI